MTRLRLGRIGRLIEVHPVRIHDEKLAVAVRVNLSDYSWAGLGFVLAAWRTVALVMNRSSNAWLLFHLLSPWLAPVKL